MGTKLAKAEDLGAQGNVAESLKFMEEVEDLKKKKAAAEVRAPATFTYRSLQLFLFSHSSDKGFFWNFSMDTARKNLKLAQNFKLALS